MLARSSSRSIGRSVVTVGVSVKPSDQSRMPSPYIWEIFEYVMDRNASAIARLRARRSRCATGCVGGQAIASSLREPGNAAGLQFVAKRKASRLSTLRERKNREMAGVK
jgi:hypothetical protein